MVSLQQAPKQEYNWEVLTNTSLIIAACHHLMFRVGRGLTRIQICGQTMPRGITSVLGCEPFGGYQLALHR